MRKLITLVLLVFALALGASVMAQGIPGGDEEATVSTTSESGAVTEAVISVVSTAAYAEDAVSVSDPDTETATPVPQEGEPVKTTFRILMALTILTGAGALLKFTHPLRKRRARTLLFQPPQTT
jgi:hypothetical protein